MNPPPISFEFFPPNTPVGAGKVKGVVTDPESLATLPVRSASRPEVSARLEDVARIERARAPATQYSSTDGREAISLAINKKAGSNTLELVDHLRRYARSSG